MHEEADECVVTDAAVNMASSMASSMPENFYEWDARGDLEPGWDGRQRVEGGRQFKHVFQACLFEWRNHEEI